MLGCAAVVVGKSPLTGIRHDGAFAAGSVVICSGPDSTPVCSKVHPIIPCISGLTIARLRLGMHPLCGERIGEIAQRHGLGALPADGVREAAARIGPGSAGWALHVKGPEMAIHDPRGKKAMRLG